MVSDAEVAILAVSVATLLVLLFDTALWLRVLRGDVERPAPRSRHGSGKRPGGAASRLRRRESVPDEYGTTRAVRRGER